MLPAAPPDRAGGCPPALSEALLGFTLLLWHNGHGNVGLTMAGGERMSVPQHDKDEAPAILLWYHGRYRLVPWYPHSTPRATRDVLDSWNWLALERILLRLFRLTVKCGTKARDRRTRGRALARESVSENEIGTHPPRMSLKSLMQPWWPTTGSRMTLTAPEEMGHIAR